MPLDQDQDLNLNPQTIALPTFQTLLSKYPTTVSQKTRAKTLAKTLARKTPVPKGKAKSTRTRKRSASHQGQEEISPEAEKIVESAVREFGVLDEWRYDSLPGIVWGRCEEILNQHQEQGNDQGQEQEQEQEREQRGGIEAGKSKEKAYLSKDEVVKLMEWKLYVPFPFSLSLSLSLS